MFWRVAGGGCLKMVTLEKTCPPYSALNVDTGFTTRAIGEANRIPAKKHCVRRPTLPLGCLLLTFLMYKKG